MLCIYNDTVDSVPLEAGMVLAGLYKATIYMAILMEGSIDMVVIIKCRKNGLTTDIIPKEHSLMDFLEVVLLEVNLF